MLVECDLWVCVSVACWCWCVCVSQFDLVFYNFIQISLFLYFFFFFFLVAFLDSDFFSCGFVYTFFLLLCSSKNTKSALVRFFVFVDKLMHYIYINIQGYIYFGYQLHNVQIWTPLLFYLMENLWFLLYCCTVFVLINNIKSTTHSLTH